MWGYWRITKNEVILWVTVVGKYNLNKPHILATNALKSNNTMTEYKNCAVYNIIEDFLESADSFTGLILKSFTKMLIFMCIVRGITRFAQAIYNNKSKVEKNS